MRKGNGVAGKNLRSTNGYADIYIISVYNIIPINDCIDNWLMLECVDSGLTWTPQKYEEIKKIKPS